MGIRFHNVEVGKYYEMDTRENGKRNAGQAHGKTRWGGSVCFVGWSKRPLDLAVPEDEAVHGLI